MKHLFDWWRAHNWDLFALLGIFYAVKITVRAVLNYLRRRRDDDYYTRRNIEPDDDHPSGKGY